MRLEAVPGPGAVPFMLELLMKHGNSGSPRATSELLGPLCLRDNASALCSCFSLFHFVEEPGSQPLMQSNKSQKSAVLV